MVRLLKRLPNGKFGLNRTGRMMKAGRARLVKGRGGKGIVRLIKRVLAKSQETKYVSTELTDQDVYGNLDPEADGTTKGGNVVDKRLFLQLPPVANGTLGHQRIGNSIKPIKCRITAQYYFAQAPLAAGQDTHAADLAQLIEVRQLSVQPKGIRRIGEWTANVAGTASAGYKHYLPKMLEVGDGHTVAPDSQNSINLTYPISNENFTALKGNKRFILGKNNGGIIGETNPLTTARAQNTLHWNLKLPKVLKYDEDNSPYPTNFCPLFGAYAGYVNGSGYSYDSRMSPYQPATFGPTHPIVRMQYRVELWYKDA